MTDALDETYLPRFTEQEKKDLLGNLLFPAYSTRGLT